MSEPVVHPHTSRAIDVVRGIAALGVIWGHSMYGLERPVELNGAYWVWIFLSLSGYLVMRGFSDGGYERSVRGVGGFLWNRMLRILPLAWVALGIGLFVATQRGDVPGTVVRQFLFVPPRNDMSLVGAMWTIAAELQFYVAAALVLPLLARCGVAYRRVIGVVLLGAAWWASRYWLDHELDAEIQPRTLIGNLPFFVWGIWLGTTDRAVITVPRFVKVVLFVALVGVAWYLQNHRIADFWRWADHPEWWLGGAAACAIAVSWVVLKIGVPDRASRFWGSGPVAAIVNAGRWCGERTYGIYVWHAVLLVVNNFFWQVPTGPPRLALLLAALPIAAASYRWFEQPWLRFKVRRRRGSGGIAAAVAVTQA
jgi:peptidoglycan/LPS O-acetylase OafA/YrhL